MIPALPELQVIEIDDLSKGINVYDPPTRIGKGFYEDALNMLLVRKTPETIGGTTKLNTTAAPNGSNIVWAEMYTGAGLNTEILVAVLDGAEYRLYSYSTLTDTWTHRRSHMGGANWHWTHAPFRGSLLFTSGTITSATQPMKYDGTDVIELGSKLIAGFESTESWSGGTADTTDPVHNLQSRRIVNGTPASLTPASPWDLTTGILGAANFNATTDSIFFWAKSVSGAAISLTLRFGNAADTVYFERTQSISAVTTWQRIGIARSVFTTAGAPNWNTIAKLTITNNTAATTLDVDSMCATYAVAPVPGSLIEVYAQQAVVGGIPADPIAVVYSDAGTPDYFTATSIARFSGGRSIFEKADQLTALKSYFDELIVGKVNSSWTFSGTGTNVSISALPLTIGIDSHRGVVETPWALHFPFENNLFGARLTSRGLVSANVSSLLANLDGDALNRINAVRHDRTHTVRWTFRDIGAGTANLGLLYDYQLDAWASRYSPTVEYYTRAIVSGAREILFVQGDGYIRRADVGTTFDGTAIESYVTLPWLQGLEGKGHGNILRWAGGTFYFSGTANVQVQARFADEPHEMATASFATYGTVQATPTGDKGWVDFGVSSRWMQLRLRATALAFRVLLPLVIKYQDTGMRV